MKYPIAISPSSSDIGALNGDGQRILVSSIGALAGLLLGKSIITAAAGAGIGYLLSSTDTVQGLFK